MPSGQLFPDLTIHVLDGGGAVETTANNMMVIFTVAPGGTETAIDTLQTSDGPYNGVYTFTESHASLVEVAGTYTLKAYYDTNGDGDITNDFLSSSSNSYNVWHRVVIANGSENSTVYINLEGQSGNDIRVEIRNEDGSLDTNANGDLYIVPYKLEGGIPIPAPPGEFYINGVGSYGQPGNGIFNITNTSIKTEGEYFLHFVFDEFPRYDEYLLSALAAKTITVFPRAQVVLSSPSPGESKSGPVSWNVSYTNAASHDLTGKVTFNASEGVNTTGASVNVLNPTSATPTIEISGFSGDGTIEPQVAVGAAVNGDGIESFATHTSQIEDAIVDNTIPTVSLGIPSVTATTSGPVSFTATYSDLNNININLLESSLNIITTGTASYNNDVSITGTGLVRTITFPTISGDGTIQIESIAAGTGIDLAGNSDIGWTGFGTTFDVDNTAPDVVILPPSITETTDTPVEIPVRYDDATFVTITLFDETDVIVNTSEHLSIGSVNILDPGFGFQGRTVILSDFVGAGTFQISLPSGTGTDEVGHVAGEAGPSLPVTVVSAADPNHINSTIEASNSRLEADGMSTSTIKLTLADPSGGLLTKPVGFISLKAIVGGIETPTVSFSTPKDQIADTYDPITHTYSVDITNTAAELVTIQATVNGELMLSTAIIEFVPSGTPSPSHLNTTISATPSTLIPADGVTESLITVTIADLSGDILSGSAGTVTLSSTGSARISAVQNNNDGTYTALVNNTAIETVTISGQLNGEPITNTASVQFVDESISSFRGKLEITQTGNREPDGTYLINVSFEDADGRFSLADATAGNVIYDESFHRYVVQSVDQINNQLTVEDIDVSGPPSGTAAIFKVTPNRLYPLSIAGIPAKLAAFIKTQLSKQLDQDVSSIKDN